MPVLTDLDALAFEFFREFARCECCLKAVGFRKNDVVAQPDWDAFAQTVRQTIEEPTDHKVVAAVQYFSKHPPKKQVVKDGELAWSAQSPLSEPTAQEILVLLRRVRNNLFHGGKFNGNWFAPQRSEELLTHGLVLLRACIAGNDKMKKAFNGSIGTLEP